MRRWIIVMALVLVSTGAQAQDYWDGWNSAFFDPTGEQAYLRWFFSGDSKVSIEIVDIVKDGCWTNASAVATAIELGLRRAGVSVYDPNVDEVGTSQNIRLTVSGFEVRQNRAVYGCTAGIQMKLISAFGPELLPFLNLKNGVDFYGMSNAWLATSGAGDTMNNTVRDWAIEATDALALRILRARDAE